ncbi:MAG: hypothetical protein PHG63_01675 [Candidatus Dojkabacteria bacterium]|jgi:uncharacterized protein YoxC|nr:hypothetical protein [Candidatus Dojkabacteria bacterium]
MEEIPSWFWMAIVSGLSAMLALIMYYIAMLLRETTLTVREFKYMVVEFHDILDSAKALLEKVNRISETISDTVEAVSVSVLQPLAVVGSWVTAIKSAVSRFTGGEEEAVETEQS